MREKDMKKHKHLRICFETFKEHCIGGADSMSIARGDEVG